MITSSTNIQTNPGTTGYLNGIANSDRLASFQTGLHFIRWLFNVQHWKKEDADDAPKLVGRASDLREDARYCGCGQRIIRTALQLFRGTVYLFKRALRSEHYESDKTEKDKFEYGKEYHPLPMVDWDLCVLGTKKRFTGITDPEIIRKILMKNRNLDRCPFRGGLPFERTSMLLDEDPNNGKQLFSARNEEYMKLRRHFNRTLKTEKLYHNKELPGQLKTYSMEVIELLKSAPSGFVEDLSKTVKNLPSKVIQCHLFGEVIDGVQEAFWELLPYIHKDISNLPRFWPTNARIKSKDGYIFLERTAREIWDNFRKYPGLLSEMKMAENRSHEKLFDFGNVFGTMMLFLLAGEDTLSSALCSSLYVLAKNPDIQGRLLKELSPHSHEETIPLEELDKIPYLEWFLKEVLRLYPPIPAQVRYVNETRENSDEPVCFVDSEKNTYELEENRQVVLFLTEAQRHPTYWKEPHKFIPERFDPEQMETFQTPEKEKAWFPFARGPNSCLGRDLARLELKAFLYYCLREGLKFRTDQTVELDYGVSLRSRQPITMEVSVREKVE